MSEFRKLRALRAPERRLVAACVLAGPVVAAGVRLFGLRRTQSALARWSPVTPAGRGSGAEAAERARMVARIAGIASRRGPVRIACVPRSLLVWWLLRREGIEVAIRVGASGTGAGFHAHAWVEHEGRPLGESTDPGFRFAAFDRDFAAPAGTAP